MAEMKSHSMKESYKARGSHGPFRPGCMASRIFTANKGPALLPSVSERRVRRKAEKLSCGAFWSSWSSPRNLLIQ